MDLKSLIPRDKSDLETAHLLKGYSYSELEPIIPELLKWIQDMNWPVAGPVATYLESISENLTDDILVILNGNDDVWKYWCVKVFGWSTNKKIDPQLMESFRRIASTPTVGEVREGVQELAMETIEE